MSKKNGGRDEHGRFAPGNGGGPGRPPRAAELSYLRELTTACPPDTWRRVCEHAVQDALAGDATARSWLSKYLLGADPHPQALVMLSAAAFVNATDEELAMQEVERNFSAVRLARTIEEARKDD